MSLNYQESTPSKQAIKIKKTQSIISEKNSIEESGIIEDIIADLIKIINSYGNILGKSNKSVSKKLNSDYFTEMMNVR